MNNKIGQLIKSARTHKGLSQAELASKAGVSQAAIGHWERGTFTPRGKNINALAEILGVTLQADLPLPELEGTKEETAALNARLQRNMLAHGDTKQAVASNPKSQAEEFERWLGTYLDGFDDSVYIKSPANYPSHDPWKIQFISDRTIVEVRHANSYHRIGETIERALWRLAFLKVFYGDDMMYVAVIRRPSSPFSLANTSPNYERLLTRLCAEADLVGITLLLVDTAQEAALAILDLEGRAPQPDE